MELMKVLEWIIGSLKTHGEVIGVNMDTSESEEEMVLAVSTAISLPQLSLSKI